MRILFLAPFAIWKDPHLTEVELAVDHLRQGDEVHVIQCLSELKRCHPNPKHLRHLCAICEGKSSHSLDLLGIPKCRRHSLKAGLEAVPTLPNFANTAELKLYQWRGMEVGVQIAAWLTTWFRDPELDICEHLPLVRDAFQLYVQVYWAVTKVVEAIRPARLYVANGSGPIFNAGAQAAGHLGVEVCYHERPTNDSYSLSDRRYHQISAIKQQIETAARELQRDTEGLELAHKQFHELRSCVKHVNWIAPLFRAREAGRLPVGFDPSRRNIALFNSSEDEIAAYDEYRSPIFPSQVDLLSRMLDEFKDPEFHFYVRIHPFLAGLKTRQIRSLAAVNSPMVTVISADSPVDSYTLLEKCEKVITFGSTIGIEATYWGKPSILLGTAIYEDLDVCYRPSSLPEIFSLIRGRKAPKPQINTLPFGYWQKKSQLPYRHVSLDGKWGKIGGRLLRPPIPTWILAEGLHLGQRITGKVKRSLFS